MRACYTDTSIMQSATISRTCANWREKPLRQPQYVYMEPHVTDKKFLVGDLVCTERMDQGSTLFDIPSEPDDTVTMWHGIVKIALVLEVRGKKLVVLWNGGVYWTESYTLQLLKRVP